MSTYVASTSSVKSSIIKKNIAGRWPENNRNRFVDRQSKKTAKKDRPKTSSFH